MSNIPNMPNVPGGGWRQQQAAEIRAATQARSAPRTNAPADTEGGHWHTVREGETLESIAQQHGRTADELLRHPANAERQPPDSDADAVTPGQELYLPTEDEDSARPVGQGDYVVKQGDCISSIAKETGYFWETIWNDPANSELREVRSDPNVLLPGDRVTIPQKQRKEEPRETEQRHRFVRRGEPAVLRLRLLRRGGVRTTGQRLWQGGQAELRWPDEHRGEFQPEPLAGEPYVIDIDGREISGVTTADGLVQIPLYGNERRARLKAGVEPDILEHILQLGDLDPIDSVTGVQQRLNNLGYQCGRPDGIVGRRTRAALAAFQNDAGIRVTRRCDQPTRDALMERHGC